jgi:hypothetical protein
MFSARNCIIPPVDLVWYKTLKHRLNSDMDAIGVAFKNLTIHNKR